MRSISSRKWIVLSIVFGVLASTILFNSFSSIAMTHAAASVGTPTDPNIKYIGRWDTSSSTVAISYWPGAYLKTSFTGTTVKIKLGGAVNIFASIDHGTDTFYANANANGTVNLTPTRLAAGLHTLRVASYSEHDVLRFQGLLLNAGAKTAAPAISSKLHPSIT